ncbi:MAG: preprotein translocase subunit SecE [Deltaproteobacteria bacterium]|nr:preprotein translocase subunit SecE [Deltaproteobacteria bacterium]
MANQKKKKRGIRKPNKSESGPVDVKQSAISPDRSVQESRQKVHPVSSKKGSEEGQGIKGLSRYIKITTQFLREAKFELKKVKWPTRKELIASATMVIVLSLAVALFLGLVDFALIKIIKMIVG